MGSIAPDPARRTPKPSKPPDILSVKHRRMLGESAIAPEISDGRGYWTATSRSQLVGLVPKYQRRVPALVVPAYSPDGETTGVQLRPNRPRVRNGKAIKYETPGGALSILDVHPSMHEAARDPGRDLWITEGVKKADSLASRGECAIALTGVWNWQRKGVMLPCWDHIALRRRRAFIVYDADVMTNPNVQLALERLVRALEGRGAEVLVVYLPGPEKGVDDHLAAGGTVAGLRLLARRFERQDLARERLTRDEGLRIATGELWRICEAMPARKMGECSARAAMRDLVRAAERGGKLEKDGVRVIRSMRDIADGAQLSLRSVKKAVERLEEAGYLRREMWGRAKDKPGAYVLLTPSGGGRALGKHNGKGAVGGEERGEGEEKGFSRRKPLFIGPSDRGVYLTRAPGDDVPELRWPKVVHEWAWREGRRVVVDSVYFARHAKRRGEILRYLLAVSSATVGELVERYGGKRTRPRDFRRRMLGPLERDGIVAIEGDNVRLTPAWREALERARERDGEVEDARLQAARHAREKAAFRRAREHPAEATPGLPGKAAVREMLSSRRPEWERQRVEDQRRKVGITAEVFLADELEGTSGLLWAEVRRAWMRRGGDGEELRRAARRGPFRLAREADDQLYVYPRETPVPNQGPAPVVELRRPEPEVEASRRREPLTQVDPGEADPGGDWRDHPLDCECQRCSTPEVRYATPRSVS